MGRSKSSCLKIITCARGDSDEDDDRAASPESKVSSDKRRWSFRKRSPGHQVQGSTLVSEPVCVSYNKENSDVTASNFHSPKSSSVSEKALIKDTPPLASVTIKSEPIALLVPCGNSDVSDHNIQESVVVIIQAFIRGYLVRRELPKLKNVVKLQAAVRGHLVRRQAVGTLRCAQAIIKMQALIRARRARMLSKKLEEEDEKFQMDIQSPATLGEKNSCMKPDIRYNSTKVLLSNEFARQLMECTPKTRPIYINCDPSKSDSAWQWLERWMAVIASEGQEQEQNLQSCEGQEKNSTLDFEAGNDDTFAGLSASSDSKLLPCESAVPTGDNMHLITKTSGEFEFHDLTYIPENSLNTLMKDDQDKSLLHNEIVGLKPEKDTEVKAYNEKFISPLSQRSLQTDTTSELVQVSISDQPESDSNLENHNRMAVREAWEDEKKEFVAGPKRCNSIISDGQSKFEELISASTVGKTIDSSQDATTDSRLDDSHFHLDSSTKIKDLILPENSVLHDSRVKDGASECGTEIFISSTLDSHDRSEAEGGEILLELGSMEKQKNDANGGSDVSFNPENAQAKNPSFHQEPLQPERLAECDQIPGDSFTSIDAAQSKQQSAEPGISDMQSQAGNPIHQQIDRSSLEGTPRSHTIAPELDGTPSSQNSVNAKKNRKESRKPGGKLISQIGKRSPSNSTKDSGGSSMEQLKKDSKSAKRRNSFGTAIPDHVDEPRISTSSSSLPSYMQATESARAKAHASLSPKASPDLHNKDNHMKKRHSLPIANGKQVSSPRMQSLTSQALQSPKGNDIHSPHNSAERRWQR